MDDSLLTFRLPPPGNNEIPSPAATTVVQPKTTHPFQQQQQLKLKQLKQQLR